MRAFSAVGAGVRHTAYVAAQALLIAAIIGALAFAAATYLGGAPGGAKSVFAKGSGSWIELKGSTNRSAVNLTLGSTVSFDTSYPTSVKNPRIEVLCYQNGVKVYGEAGGVTDTFLLGGGGSVWKDQGGSADCTANLYYFGSRAGKQTYNWLASTDFLAN